MAKPKAHAKQHKADNPLGAKKASLAYRFKNVQQNAAIAKPAVISAAPLSSLDPNVLSKRKNVRENDEKILAPQGLKNDNTTQVVEDVDSGDETTMKKKKQESSSGEVSTSQSTSVLLAIRSKPTKLGSIAKIVPRNKRGPKVPCFPPQTIVRFFADWENAEIPLTGTGQPETFTMSYEQIFRDSSLISKVIEAQKKSNFNEDDLVVYIPGFSAEKKEHVKDICIYITEIPGNNIAEGQPCFDDVQDLSPERVWTAAKHWMTFVCKNCVDPGLKGAERKDALVLADFLGARMTYRDILAKGCERDVWVG